jgi:hypothetical protein
MNVWKPIALCSIATTIASFGIHTASAEGVCHNQPNMAAAKGSLEAALGSLQKAEHNKGGWRDRAIAAVKTAQTEVTAGCAVADTK